MRIQKCYEIVEILFLLSHKSMCVNLTLLSHTPLQTINYLYQKKKKKGG